MSSLHPFPVTDLTQELAQRATAVVWQLSRAYLPCAVEDVEDRILSVLLDLFEKLQARPLDHNDDHNLKAFIRHIYLSAANDAHSRSRRAATRRGRRKLVTVGAQPGGHPDPDHEELFIHPTSTTIDEVTTEEAARFLHVSRPYLVKLIDTGRLPARRVGRYRRVAVSDLVSYREKMFRQASSTCRDLADLAHAEESAGRLHGKEDAR